ncbi:DUF3368 domain-containing protein [Altericista sp. CCNU0014]|uniref:DUF3368 domain-containing protein n=1 Tax=Altericista sp. CCNU0014 TaxID=3082949 RepID=UPI00384ABEDD
MLIVSNTSPILNLAIIEHLDLIKQQFIQVIIPPGVLGELKVNEDRPGSLALRNAVSEGWIKIQPLTQSQTVVQLLRQTLDQGESEAIALALEQQADYILLDERDGRKVAKSLGLNVTGVLGVLLKAKQSGAISQLKPLLEDLIQVAGFRISPVLLAQLLAMDVQK